LLPSQKTPFFSAFPFSNTEFLRPTCVFCGNSILGLEKCVYHKIQEFWEGTSPDFELKTLLLFNDF